jgi:L-2-hydroxyglutarate oxidase
MTEFCRANGIAHEICGKLVVATNDAEAGRLKGLYERGCENGLTGLRILSSEQIREIEPHAAGISAIHVPEEGIVDYSAVVAALAASVQWLAITQRGDFSADFLLNTAGLYSDRVCKMAAADPKTRIVPFRGEYYKLSSTSTHLVHNLIYPVPNPQFPFLGVHFTRLIHGGIEAGPNAVLALAREGYRKTDFNPRDTFDAVTYGGLLRFLKKHYRMCISETARSFSGALFCRSLQKLVPEIRLGDLEPGGAGVRAQALSPNGSLVDDFQLIHGDRSLHVVNAPSPAATASLAIGEEIAAAVAQKQGWPVSAVEVLTN